MKRYILLIASILVATSSFSQVVVQVVSNPCNPASIQSYPFEYAGEIDGSSTDWNTPNILLPANAIQAELVFAEDGTDVGVFANLGTPPISVETTTDACDSATWIQDLTGKIAVLWRGNCAFGLKAFNAQKRGAIGVLMINHTGAAMGMAGGTYGVNVTIPVVMIGRQDGENLMTCITGGGVEVFIGNNNGLLLNNMSSSIADILMPESLAMPWDLAQNGTEYPVAFGMWVYNKGSNSQDTVTATVNVTYEGTSVYSQTSIPVGFAAPDTTYLDSNYFDLGTYAPALWNVGTYTVNYSIDNANDQYLIDNFFTYEFKLTNNNDVYSKCRLDSFNQPINPTSVTVTEILEEDNWTTCISFISAYAGQRSSLALGITFSAFRTDSIVNRGVEIKCYQWNDVFTNIFSPPSYNNLVELESKSFTYSNESQHGENIYLPFNNVISLLDNQRYLFCLHNNNSYDGLRIGFDNEIDYKTTINHYLQPLTPASEPTPTLNWYHYGFGTDLTPAISVTMDIATTINETKTETTLYPYPNPANNLLTIPLRNNVIGNVNIEIFDLTGKLVLSENQIFRDESLKLNVAAIKNGQYLFKITFSDKSTDVFKVAVNR